MTEPVSTLTLFAIALLGLAVGAVLVYLLMQRRLGSLNRDNATLSAQLEAEQRSGAEKITALEAARAQLTHTFTALASDALRSNNAEFLKLAQENLKQFHIKAQGDLEQKEKSIEQLVKPIKDALEKNEKQIHQIELERKESFGSLSKHLETMALNQQSLQSETRNLVQALRRPEVRGQWGELTLKRLAELAGMVEYCDFYEQEHTATADGGMRPDMIVRMPDGREIIVDVKTPLDAYLSAVEAPDDATRALHLESHARNVVKRVRELAAKSYWEQFKNAPDFIVLFIPGDQFLNAALDIQRDLIETALRQKVILATPTSFVALLRAVAYGWRQQTLAVNAERIRDVGEELYKRLGVFAEHLAKVGKNLNSSVDSYNAAVGSFERQLIPGARKFAEMGVETGKLIETPEPLEKQSLKLTVATGKSSVNKV